MRGCQANRIRWPRNLGNSSGRVNLEVSQKGHLSASSQVSLIPIEISRQNAGHLMLSLPLDPIQQPFIPTLQLLARRSHSEE